jgi:hypothetical protein
MATLKNTLIDDTGYLQLPSGTTAQRPVSPSAGYMRFNTTESVVEVYSNGQWKSFAYADGIPVTDGLIMYLDAGDTNSYPGTGGTWTDLSGNGNNATIYGTNTWTSTDGGKFDFRGDSQTTKYISLPASVLQSYGNTFTKIFWMQPVSDGGRYFNSVAGTVYGDNAAIMSVTNNTIGSYLGGSTISFTNDAFLQVTLTRPNSNSGALRKNKDSSVSATLNSLTAASTGGWILNQEQDSVGGGFSASQNVFAAFSVILFYNRVLSTAEIDSIYDYFSSRY